MVLVQKILVLKLLIYDFATELEKASQNCRQLTGKANEFTNAAQNFKENAQQFKTWANKFHGLATDVGDSWNFRYAAMCFKYAAEYFKTLAEKLVKDLAETELATQVNDFKEKAIAFYNEADKFNKLAQAVGVGAETDLDKIKDQFNISPLS